MYVTLEPCCHVGKQPPCTEALIEAGIARVIAARPDPNPVSGGGKSVLERAGVLFEFTDASPSAGAISDPFVKGTTRGLPWVIAKWAQTVDGRLVTGHGEPRWISGEAARRRVHRLRARVDAIVTGMGTVLAYDPMLNARGVRVHRLARRVIIDPKLELPAGCRLVRTARDVPVTVVGAGVQSRADLVRAGVQTLALPIEGRRVPMREVLAALRRVHGVATVMVEAGPKLLRQMFEERIIDAAIVHVPGHLMRDAMHAAAVGGMPGLAEGFEVCRARRCGADTEALYWRVSGSRV